MLRSTIRHWLFDRFGQGISRFMHIESSAGLVLIAATLAAMAVKNSPMSEHYADFLNLSGQIRVGEIDVNKPLFLWVNDLWMAIFFFVVGLEIKREWLFGSLRDRSQAVLPVFGAIGGVVMPAAVYLAINWQDSEAIRGWAIPTATDIAFALAVLSLLGSRVPQALKMFLMTLAILDDLIAIVVIALLYTGGLSAFSMLASALVLSLMLCLRWLGIRQLAPYLMLGMILWVCVLKSGIHATLAGVVTALIIPSWRQSDGNSNLQAIIDDLHPWIAFFILPAFAFVNAGIDFSELNMDNLLKPLPLGIFLGLLLGKVVGVFTVTAVIIRLGLARLPEGCNWGQLFGVSLLCGIGFTMSLFIGGLAFAEIGLGYARIDRFAVILASSCSAVLGYLVIYLSSQRRKSAGDSRHGATDQQPIP